MFLAGVRHIYHLWQDSSSPLRQNRCIFAIWGVHLWHRGAWLPPLTLLIAGSLNRRAVTFCSQNWRISPLPLFLLLCSYSHDGSMVLEYLAIHLPQKSPLNVGINIPSVEHLGLLLILFLLLRSSKSILWIGWLNLPCYRFLSISEVSDLSTASITSTSPELHIFRQEMHKNQLQRDAGEAQRLRETCHLGLIKSREIFVNGKPRDLPVIFMGKAGRFPVMFAKTNHILSYIEEYLWVKSQNGPRMWNRFDLGFKRRRCYLQKISNNQDK